MEVSTWDAFSFSRVSRTTCTQLALGTTSIAFFCRHATALISEMGRYCASTLLGFALPYHRKIQTQDRVSSQLQLLCDTRRRVVHLLLRQILALRSSSLLMLTFSTRPSE